MSSDARLHICGVETMFKRKSNLPPRPSFPTARQIISDLQAAAEDTKFAETAKGINFEAGKTEESQARDVSYEEVKKFLAQYEDLKGTMTEVQRIYEDIEKCRDELKTLSEDLMVQASKVIV